MQFRDLQNPTGADIEVFVNQQLGKALSSAALPGKGFLAGDYDIQVCKANEHPGLHWEFVSAVSLGHDVFIVWRMSRVKQTELGLGAIMKIPETPAGQRRA